MFRKKRRSYKFTEKRHSKKAMVSSALAVMSLICYLVFIYLSYRAGGQLSAYYGGFGVLAMLVAVVALGLSFTTVKEENSFQFFPRMAVIISVLSTLLWIGTYMEGFLKG